MKKYKCHVCGYIYNPEYCDVEHGIDKGTAFEDLSDDWGCPICGIGKSAFLEVVDENI